MRMSMKLFVRFGVASVLLLVFVFVCVYEVRESSYDAGRPNDLASVYQPMKVTYFAIKLH
jgi:hypothetical protein